MKVVKPGPDREVPRGVVGGSEVSEASAGARQIYMGVFRVEPGARGTGLADALIAACADLAREHGARTLSWSTAPDNHRAQAVYDRSGAVRSSWLEYELEVER